ncbi:EPIDERMAL PATTERNING FACTOR-like protein 1 [Corylus avellana]|uniref:EPIDERMAL PATTERNING FACTOR-like protein 1 n=1 Tax=Corylus avellana TaxID=13451 RepID=UPI001E224B58|nr:EPIDERMAL PATTERNING FACTOR-like protein 1 [Corylus avellana]
MAIMNSINSFLLLRTTTLVIVVLYLISQASCSNHPPPTSSPLGLLFEEKIRIGSIPPSCHNKCNQCHPCMAVQVPTMPSQPGAKSAQTVPVEVSDPSPRGNKYSNYKPLGWKCRCQDRLYNP